MIPAPEELGRLHRQCLAALREYMSQAHKTCQLLSKATKHPLTIEMREGILKQRKAENDARSRYMEIRDRALRIATESETDLL